MDDMFPNLLYPLIAAGGLFMILAIASLRLVATLEVGSHHADHTREGTHPDEGI